MPFMARAHVPRRKLIGPVPLNRLTAPGEQQDLRMTLLDVARSRIRDQSDTPRRVSAGKQQRKWRRATLEFLGTLVILLGLAIGLLTLRFALLLMHGALH